MEEAWKAVGFALNSTVTGLDFSVVEPFFYDRRCGLDEFSPSVNITNLGDSEYLPAMGAILKLSVTNNALPEYTLPINETILPGEVLTVVVDDWLISDVPKSFNIQVRLELTDSDPDNNPDNNISSLPFRIYEFSYGDLGLTTNYQLPPCFSTEMETAFYITNNGCEPIPAGTTYKLSVADSMGAVLWSEDYTLANDHIPFRTQFTIYQLDLGAAPKAELNFLVEFSDDPDPSNNSEVEEAPFYETITGDYLNDFEGDLAIDPTLYHSVDIPSPSILYDGSGYFVSTGRSTSPDRIDICPNYEDNFGKTGFYSGNHGKIRTCLDLTGANAPYLSFDLVQFRNEEATANNYLYSCMLQTKWSGTDEGEEIIFGQNEGVPQHYGYSLPDDFKGELAFTFYTEYGQYIFNQSSPNFDHDVLLMDNLQLQADFTKTTELENGKSVLVSPNPAKNQLNIRSENRLTAVELRSINGQLLKQEKINASVFNLSIDEFENGVYLLRLQDGDGEWVVKKVVKVE
ncbi:MAG: T9SS type A sorting domain-containing protein [Saprospiraceae bacterium]